jgi:hypothetical protein
VLATLNGDPAERVTLDACSVARILSPTPVT